MQPLVFYPQGLEFFCFTLKGCCVVVYFIDEIRHFILLQFSPQFLKTHPHNLHRFLRNFPLDPLHPTIPSILFLKLRKILIFDGIEAALVEILMERKVIRSNIPYHFSDFVGLHLVHQFVEGSQFLDHLKWQIKGNSLLCFKAKPACNHINIFLCGVLVPHISSIITQ